MTLRPRLFLFFLNDPPPPEIYPLPLHAALPISRSRRCAARAGPRPAAIRVRSAPAAPRRRPGGVSARPAPPPTGRRSEEHTSELQSPCNLVCRLLLEKKNNTAPHECRLLAMRSH